MQVVVSKDGSLSQSEHGAVRSTDAMSTRYDLISPVGLRRLAETYAEGAKKYGDCNWELGFPVSDILNHAIRHLYIFLSGDRSEDHLAHAAWGLFSAMHFEELRPDLLEDMRTSGCTLSAKQLETIKARNDARIKSNT